MQAYLWKGISAQHVLYLLQAQPRAQIGPRAERRAFAHLLQIQAGEVFGQMLGITPQRLSESYTIGRLEYEHQQYYITRKELIMAQYARALGFKGEERKKRIAAVVGRLRAYNSTAPGIFAITSAGLRASMTWADVRVNVATSKEERAASSAFKRAASVPARRENAKSFI